MKLNSTEDVIELNWKWGTFSSLAIHSKIEVYEQMLRINSCSMIICHVFWSDIFNHMFSYILKHMEHKLRTGMEIDGPVI